MGLAVVENGMVRCPLRGPFGAPIARDRCVADQVERGCGPGCRVGQEALAQRVAFDRSEDHADEVTAAVQERHRMYYQRWGKPKQDGRGAVRARKAPRQVRAR